MAKSRVGLQKGVSSIFTGVQIPKAQPVQDALNSSPAGPAQYVPPKPQPQTRPQPATVQPSIYNPPAPPPPPPAPLQPPAAPEPKVEVIPKAPKQSFLVPLINKFKLKLAGSGKTKGSKRQRTMLFAAPALFIVMIIVLFQALGKPARPAARPNGKITPTGKAAATVQINWKLPNAYPSTLRDPMVFGAVPVVQTDTVVETPQEAAFVVKGIVFSDDRPTAVIGEEIVFVGDIIEGATVIKINPDSVEFQKGDKTWTQEVER